MRARVSVLVGKHDKDVCVRVSGRALACIRNLRRVQEKEIGIETIYKGRLISCSYELQPITDLISRSPSAEP